MRPLLVLPVALLAGTLHAHQLNHEVQTGSAVIVELSYGDGSPFGYESAEVYRPAESIPFLAGRTDANGRLAFVPDRAGDWRIKASPRTVTAATSPSPPPARAAPGPPRPGSAPWAVSPSGSRSCSASLDCGPCSGESSHEVSTRSYAASPWRWHPWPPRRTTVSPASVRPRSKGRARPSSSRPRRRCPRARSSPTSRSITPTGRPSPQPRTTRPSPPPFGWPAWATA